MFNFAKAEAATHSQGSTRNLKVHKNWTLNSRPVPEDHLRSRSVMFIDINLIFYISKVFNYFCQIFFFSPMEASVGQILLKCWLLGSIKSRGLLASSTEICQ